jgi:phosphopantothenoylcysteine decarboxylase/phosphopantothenate--cysteine ligase
MAAAVADYRVAEVADHKIKRTGDDLTLRLVPNPDIIAGIKDARLVKIGFAAETDDLLANAQSKLRRKGLDLIVANDVTAPGSGFGTDTNEVVVVSATGAERLPLLPKRAVADRILDRLVSLLAPSPP